MIKPDMIPDEVVDHVWKRCECVRRFDAREAIAAAINAWPQMHLHEWQRPWLGGMSGTDIILPVPKENTNAET